MDKIMKHSFYIGLNDKDTLLQKIGLDSAVKMLIRMVNRNGYPGATLFKDAIGFFTHKDGRTTIEPSLKLEILFGELEKSKQLLNDIKKELNQESVYFEMAEVYGQFM